METAVIIILVALGLIMPLFWIVGAAVSVGYVAISRGRDFFAKAGMADAAAFNGQLGVTMADGGDSIAKKEEKKEK